jgi:hypothetical protein
MIMKAKLPLMKALFIVTGMKFSPYKCTQYFDVEPSTVETKGDLRIKARKQYPVRNSLWSVHTKWARFDNTDVPLQLLLDVIWPKHKQIRDFSMKNKLEIQFLLNMNGAGERNFLYRFSPRTLEQIAYFRSPLHLDVY